MERLTAEQRELVERNLPLVSHIVRRFAKRLSGNRDRDDLTQAGVLGLIQASTRFDPTNGASFSTFAGRRIEGAILDELRSEDWAPRSVRALERQLHEAETAARQAYDGRPVNDESMSEALGVKPCDINRLRARINQAAVESLDRNVNRKGDTCPLSELVVDLNDLGVEGDLEERELLGYVRDALGLLSERHRMIIVGFFLQGRTATDIATFMGVTQGRVSQLKTEALELIRQAIQDQYRDGDRPEPSSSRRQRSYTHALRQAGDVTSRLQPAELKLG